MIGSIPTGYILARFKGVDIRSLGSGNIGATNVMRTVGKSAGLITFVLDFLKGAVPTLLFPDPPLTALCVVAGHCFSIFLKGKGGKGVATGVGAVITFMPLQIAAALAVFAAVFYLKRIVSLASISAAAFLGALIWLGPYDNTHCSLVTSICAIIIFRHKSNIKNLLEGIEPKSTAKTTPE